MSGFKDKPNPHRPAEVYTSGVRTVAPEIHFAVPENPNASLHESEELLRAVVENAPDAIFIQTDGCFAYLNPATLRLLGAERAEQLLGKPVLDYLHPNCRDRVRERIEELNDAKQAVEAIDEVMLTLDGAARDVNVCAVPFRYGDRDGAIVFARDITARKVAEAEHERIQAQLLHAQKLESVGRLAGGIAHDFNNILSVILNYVTFVMEDGENRQSRSDLAQIKDAARRAAVLTRQLLAFSRRQILQPEVLQLNEVVTDLARMLQRIIGEDIALSLELDPALKMVKLDRGQLEQVLMNLATNARDAMPTGGELKIATSNLEIDEQSPTEWRAAQAGSHVLLTVSDTGCGMDDTVRAQIFEPFYTTKPVGQGTGLGLSTVYGIVEQSGGRIAVETDRGQGATFKILLPAALDETQLRSVPSPGKGTLNGTETILVVEDERNVRHMVRRMLISSGYTVLTAESGTEAIRLCSEHTAPIDVLLTDVVMPGMDGRELMDRVQSLRPEIRILFMSGYTGEAIANYGVRDSEADFIAKPFDATELKTKIRALCDRGPPSLRIRE